MHYSCLFDGDSSRIPIHLSCFFLSSEKKPETAEARLRTCAAIAIAEFASARGDDVLARRMLAEGRFDLVSVLALRRAALEAERALADGEPHVARAVVDEMLPLAELIPDASYARLSALAIRSLQPGDVEIAGAYLVAAQRRGAVLAESPAGAPADQMAWLAVADAAHAAINGQPSSAL